MAEKVIIRNEEYAHRERVGLENLVAAVFEDKVVKEVAAENNGGCRFFPSVQFGELEKENQLNS